MDNIQQNLDLLVTYGFNLFGSIALILLGRWGADIISGLASSLIRKRFVSPKFITFVEKLIYYSLMVIIIIVAVENIFMGQATLLALVVFTVLAPLNSFGLQILGLVIVVILILIAISFALREILVNLASGLLLYLFKPYKVGDYVELASLSYQEPEGFVKEIRPFHTILRTRTNKTIMVPHWVITKFEIVNYSTEDVIRHDLVYGISYGSDVLQAKKILQEIVEADDYVCTEPPPFIGVQELGDSSVNLIVQVYVDVKDYWKVRFSITEQVKLRFDKEDISIPFPQRDVHLYQME